MLTVNKQHRRLRIALAYATNPVGQCNYILIYIITYSLTTAKYMTVKYKTMFKNMSTCTCLRVGPVFENVPSEKRRGYCTDM